MGNAIFHAGARSVGMAMMVTAQRQSRCLCFYVRLCFGVPRVSMSIFLSLYLSVSQSITQSLCLNLCGCRSISWSLPFCLSRSRSLSPCLLSHPLSLVLALSLSFSLSHSCFPALALYARARVCVSVTAIQTGFHEQSHLRNFSIVDGAVEYVANVRGHLHSLRPGCKKVLWYVASCVCNAAARGCVDDETLLVRHPRCNRIATHTHARAHARARTQKRTRTRTRTYTAQTRTHMPGLA
jgi:hypothetical protein